MTDDEFLFAFESKSLSPTAWHHREHIKQQPQLARAKNLRLFYSRGLLMSPRARVEFVEPDLAPLPRSRNRFTTDSRARKLRHGHAPAKA